MRLEVGYMGRGPTKAELVEEVAALKARLAAAELDGLARAHVEELAAVAAPFQRRLSEEGELAALVRRWDAHLAVGHRIDEEQVAAFKAAVARWQATRLDAKEVAALNAVLRQKAEVLGVLRGRRGGRVSGRSAPGEGPPAVSPKVPLGKVRNMVDFKKGQG